MSEDIKFPQVYKNAEGAEVIARDEVQASAFEKAGFEAVGEYVPKKDSK